MKKIYFLIILAFAAAFASHGQSTCTNNLLTNPAFSSGMTAWAQYGTVPTATVLNAQNACLDTFLIMQATNNSNCGVEQLVTLKKDSCYDLCYCLEFPFTGALYNTKLTIAAITPGVTVTQLLSGSFTSSQAQIIDTLTAANGFPPYVRCPSSFTATANFTSFVIVNQTTGVSGTDVRVDNLCLTSRPCGPSCGNVNALFSYSAGPGYNVSFTDNSTSNPGDILTYSWDFGDPPSGPANTSAQQNPSHTYPGPGAYIACLYLSAVMTNGIPCHDTVCLDIIIFPTGTGHEQNENITISPNPAKDQVLINGTSGVTGASVFTSDGKEIRGVFLQGNRVILPAGIHSGFYFLRIQTRDGIVLRKLVIE